MDAVPLEKAPKVAVYVAAQRAALGRRGHDGAAVRRHPVRQAVGSGGARRRPAHLRLAAPAPRGLHRSVLQVLPHLRGRSRGSPRWCASTTPRRASSGWPTVPDLKKAVAPRIRDYVDRTAASCSPCARRPRRSSWRWRRTTWTSPPAYADGTPMDPDAGREARLDPGASPSRARTSRRDPQVAELLGHRRPPGERRAAAPAARRVQAVQLQRQDRSGADDAGAEPPRGDPGLLRRDDVASCATG